MIVEKDTEKRLSHAAARGAFDKKFVSPRELKKKRDKFLSLERSVAKLEKSWEKK